MSRGGVWKYANTQWALYPNGGCISTGGAVLPAWFLTAPFIRLTLMPVTQSSRNSYLFLDSRKDKLESEFKSVQKLEDSKSDSDSLSQVLLAVVKLLVSKC